MQETRERIKLLTPNSYILTPNSFSCPVGWSGGIVFILNSNNGGFMMDLFCSTTLFSTALFSMSFDDFVARAWLAVIFVWLYLVFTTAR